MVERMSRRTGLRIGYATLLVIASAWALWVTGPHDVWNQAYAPVGVALLVGSLIAAPMHGGQKPSSLLLVPLVPAYWRFGGSIAPLLLGAILVANLARRVSILSAVTAGAISILAFEAADRVIASFPQAEARSLLVVWLFALLLAGAWQLAERAQLPPADDPHVERPDLVLSLATAPIGVVAIVAGDLLGEGGLLMALASLLAVLFVVGEWWRLRIAREEAEEERSRLERARVVQEELTHLITHEVRNPLTTVLGYAQLARGALASNQASHSDVIKHLDRITRAGKTIERLMENLLQINKVEMDEGVYARENVPLSI